jgi:alpha-amylase/alpha-mannosidase (GH57 family)
MNKYICIHGHFYQPPRENPFLDKIERQDSAFPYHDWNERINDECYKPNTSSRILSDKGKIVDVVNNFIYLSFNVGPTLMNWLYDNDKTTYNKIIEADYISREKNNGHGNAIAQVYSHIIMPLANERDKETQIKWGIYDFEKHYGRKPEGMWLAETAINKATVKDLINNGIKYTILSPFQAEKVKTFFSSDWQDVSNGNVDPSQPYRVFIDDKKDKFLDVFFYDAPISTAISFEHLLRNADDFAQRLNFVASANQGRPTLVNASTDGESYGHHEAFGDMCLAYFFKNHINKFEMTPINYAYFLEKFPPISEAILKDGINGEGTAWSCSHGVGRWKENCGCNTGGYADWNQEWRKPLRDGLNTLRDYLWEIYEKETSKVFKDIEKARNDYYFVFKKIWTFDKFFKENCENNPNEETKVKILELLESQRFSQLMFTSCGWFFSEISGIETVQIIKYANSAIFYAQPHSKTDLEKILLSYLEKAISNINSSHNGDAIYKKWIKPYELTAEKAVNQFIVKSYLTNNIKEENIYIYKIKLKENITFTIDNNIFHLINCTTSNLYTEKTLEHSAILFEHKGLIKIYINNSFLDIEKIKNELVGQEKIIDTISKFYSKKFSLSNLNFEESADIMDLLWSKKTKKLNKDLNKIYSGFKDLIEETVLMGGYLPTEIKSAIEIIMSSKLLQEIKDIEVWNNKNIKPAINILELSQKLHLHLNVNDSKKYLEDYLLSLIKNLEKSLSNDNINLALCFLSIYEKIGITLNKSSAETIIFHLYKENKNNKELKELALMMNILV